MNAKKHQTILQKTLITIGIVAVLFAQWVGYNENSRFALTRALVEEGRLEITSFAQTTEDRAFRNGEYYTDKAPGLSFLATPIYLVTRLFFPSQQTEGENIVIEKETGVVFQTHQSPAVQVATFLCVVIFSGLSTILTAYLLYLISFRFLNDDRKRLLIPASYPLGSIAFSGMLMFFGYATAAFFLLLAFYLFFIPPKRFRSWVGGCLAGAAAGLAFSIDYLSFFPILTIGIYALTQRANRRICWFLLGMIPFLLFIFWYNATAFGNPLQTGYSYLEWSSSKVQAKFDLSRLENFGIKIFDFPKPLSFYLAFFKYYLLVILRILFSVERGLIFFTPLMSLSLLGFFALWRRDKKLTISLAVSFLVFLLYLSNPLVSWWGDSSFGVRHLIIFLPFLFLPFMAVAEHLKYTVLLLFLVVSLGVNFIGLQPPADFYHRVVLMSEDYLQVLKSGIPFDNPITNYYIPKLLENGLNMPLLQNALDGRGLDIRNFRLTNRSQIVLGEVPGGFLLYSRSILPIIILALALFIVWFPLLSSPRTKILCLLVLLGLIFSGFSVRKTVYKAGWYTDREDEMNWMADKATLSFAPPYQGSARLWFIVEPYNGGHRSRDLWVYLNGNSLTAQPIAISGKTLIITPRIYLLNRKKYTLTFDSNNPCDIPYQIEGETNRDFRCLSFRISSPIIVPPDKLAFEEKKSMPMTVISSDGGYYRTSQQDIFLNQRGIFLIYEKGCWPPEEMGEKWHQWASKEARFKFYSLSSFRALLTFEATSYARERKLRVLLNGQLVKEASLPPGNEFRLISFPLEIKEDVNELVFSFDGCDVPAIIEGSKDTRCLSALFRTELKLTAPK